MQVKLTPTTSALVGSLLALGAGCQPLAQQWTEDTPFVVFEASRLQPAAPNPDQVRVMTWNIKYGWGRNDIFFDGWGDGVELSQAEVEPILDAQIKLMEEAAADIVMTQETDRASRRTDYVDQVSYILNHSAFNYAAYVPIWQTEYAAQNGMGPAEMGQVVFSKWPIRRNIRIDQPVSESDPGYVRYFAPRRAIQSVQVDFGGGQPLSILNVHPTAYSLDGTKQAHLAQIFETASALEGDIVIGGDFNVIPPGSINPDVYDDVVEADTIGVTAVTYTEDEMAALTPFYETYTPAFALANYQSPPLTMPKDYDQSYDGSTCAGRPDDQRQFFSHSLYSEVFWNQKLDYLFTNKAFTEPATLQCPGDGGIESEPMALSDHAPVVATLVRQ